MNDRPRRSRVVYAIIAIAVIGLGLATRHQEDRLPAPIATYAPDALWALLVFVLLGALRPWRSTLWVAGVALTFAFLIELSQLYQAPWIDALRDTRLGGLILGFGFLWSDLVCYTFGVGVGALAEVTAHRRAPAVTAPLRRQDSTAGNSHHPERGPRSQETDAAAAPHRES